MSNGEFEFFKEIKIKIVLSLKYNLKVFILII